MSAHTADPSIVIVGGGHAAAQLCAALAEAGLGPQLQLVCAEAHLPYQRPPLSKAFLKTPDEAMQPFRSAEWYADKGITVHLGDPAVAIDRSARTLSLRSGRVLPWGRLVLATGTRARRLPGWPHHATNLFSLRSADDALALRAALHAAPSLTVLGGGFIGLEIAATARAQGKPVTLLEVAPRLMGRSVSATLAAHVLALHQANGIDIRLGVSLGTPEFDGDRLLALVVDGQRLPVDCVVVGIGAEPEDDLARAAGLAVDNGVVVDASLQTSDPAILAIGDCCSFPGHARAAATADSGRLRLESVANATDMARTAAATLQGRQEPHAALPWFWSEQGGLRLQMAGLLPAGAPDLQEHRRPGATPASFSLLHYLGGQLVCVESVNAPMDHLSARKLLEAGRHPAPAQACDPATPLKNLL